MQLNVENTVLYLSYPIQTSYAKAKKPFSCTTNTLKAKLVPSWSESLDHAEQWLSKMAGAIPSVAGKQKIVLPSVVILL